MVPEISVSGIAESTNSSKIPRPRTISDEDENFIEDSLSSLTSVSDIMVSNAAPNHEYGKEKERETFMISSTMLLFVVNLVLLRPF